MRPESRGPMSHWAMRLDPLGKRDAIGLHQCTIVAIEGGDVGGESTVADLHCLFEAQFVSSVVRTKLIETVNQPSHHGLSMDSAWTLLTTI